MARVFAGLDLRPESDEMIREALAIFQGKHRIAVCHVMPELRAVRPLFPQLHAADALAAAEVEAYAREALERCLERLGSPPVEVFLESGTPSVRLVERAKSWRADLIVVGGPRGPTRSSRTAVSVVRYARSTVLVARRMGTGPVIAATDLSEPSLRAAALAVQQAEALGRPVVILHAWDTTRELGWLAALRRVSAQAREAFTSKLDDGIDHARAEIGRALGSSAQPTNIEVHVGAAASVICQRAADLDACLVVLATHGRTGYDYALVGSVAEDVVERAPCPVLVFRNLRPDSTSAA